MKYLLILITLTTSYSLPAQKIKQLVKQAGNALNPSGQNGSQLSNTEIISGLKEALEIGSRNASGQLNKTNGYFGNQLVKILLPEEVKPIERTLRSMGFGKLCDNLILSVNRAAEDAAGKAVPIFVQAITSMSIQDGLSILQGGQDAATRFLDRSTRQSLSNAFRPVIEQSLNKVNAPQLWNKVFSTYNKLPVTQRKVNTDLTAYVTDKALQGLFTMVAQEESKIRKDPAAQVTQLLKKVFGGR